MKIISDKFYHIALFAVVITVFACTSKKEIANSRFETVDTNEKIKISKEKEADEQTYFDSNYIRYDDFVYNDNIKTVLFHKKGWSFSKPIIELGSEEKLVLSFDELNNKENKSYMYSIVHCDAYWMPTDMHTMEYVQGFNEEYISDYKYSFNTEQQYIHYETTIPSDNMMILKSGNYILKIFSEDNPEDVIITRKFMLVDFKVSVEAKVKRATTIKDKNYKQEVDFQINKQGYQIDNPYSGLKVFVFQNGRRDNIIELKPQLIKNDIIDYNYESENVFDGGNEFRHFNVKNVHNLAENIRLIKIDTLGFYHFYLYDDLRKTFQVYQSMKDINGKMLIKDDEATINTDIEAEYVYVHFFLPYKSPLIEGSIYIIGDITDWRYSEESMLKYNYNKFGYEKILFLKQGYYDYQYIYMENGKTAGDISFIEGNHYETDNSYTIYIYNRETGSDYDELIGVKSLGSF